MGRARMALTQGLHDELRLGPPLDRLHAGEEAALLDQEFVLDGGLQGVGHGAQSLTEKTLHRSSMKHYGEDNWQTHQLPKATRRQLFGNCMFCRPIL